MQNGFDILQDLASCKDEDALRRAAGRHACDLGYESWQYTLAPSAPQRSPYLLGNYPAAWLAHYQRHGYGAIDPVIEHCRRHVTPCLWAAAPPGVQAPHVREFFREAADYGLRAGIGIPLHGPGHWGMVSIASARPIERDPPDLRELGTLLVFASFLHEAGQRIAGSGAADAVRLTARELDCLRWAADGKTGWEIGQVLGISERTVVFHLDNAAQKLGVIGRRQAVARAIARQLISL